MWQAHINGYPEGKFLLGHDFNYEGISLSLKRLWLYPLQIAEMWDLRGWQSIDGCGFSDRSKG